MPRALITGITGQDGSYLAEWLLSKGYTVHGTVRRSSTPSTQRIDHIREKITLIHADLIDQASLMRAIEIAEPDEIYNLASMSFVGDSFHQPVATADYTAISVTKLLEAIRTASAPIRLYQASTSEMFGNEPAPQSERTPFSPRSPYAAAKLYGHAMVRNYREGYGIFACSGILFNHESPRRSAEFVTRKITQAVAAIADGDPRPLILGNLQTRRDWGFAGDYVQAMWLMLQQPEPEDFVIATGQSHTVQDFVERAFACAQISNWQDHVRNDPALFRPTEVERLVGDASRARERLGWTPHVGFGELVAMMVDADRERRSRTVGSPA